MTESVQLLHTRMRQIFQTPPPPSYPQFVGENTAQELQQQEETPVHPYVRALNRLLLTGEQNVITYWWSLLDDPLPQILSEFFALDGIEIDQATGAVLAGLQVYLSPEEQSLRDYEPPSRPPLDPEKFARRVKVCAVPAFMMFMDKSCPVCLMELRDQEELAELPKCTHQFHKECLRMWLGKADTCPTCRATVAR